MLKNYPLKINGIKIITAESWREERDVVENIYQTEAGTDQVSVTRRDKMTVSASYRCSSRWLKNFLELSKTDPLSVEMYDAEAEGYKTRIMRMRNFRSDLAKQSERLERTEGIWDVSFTLEEF